jgi:tRNA A-37 threonylcarbamoyl transferase component Bud32
VREAYLGLLAAAAGGRTPRVLLADPFGNGAGMLVQRWVPGHSLEEAGPAEVGDQVLRAAWQQVARLHRAGIAHADLTRASVVVDQAGLPWLVDFDRAEAAAGEVERLRDVAELLVSLALERALDAAGPRDLSPAARWEPRTRPDLRGALLAAARAESDAGTPC